MLSPYRLTIVLAAVCSVLGAYVYFVDVPQTQEITIEEKRQRQLIHLDYRAIDRLAWTTPDEHFVMTRDEHGRWWITHPLTAKADSREVRKILRALVLGKISRVIEETSESATTFGLAPPYLTLTVTAGDHTESVDLGDPGPLTSTLYARQGPDGPIVLTSLDVRTFAGKSLDHFRRKDILSFDRHQISRIELEQSGEKITLVRARGIHGFTHHWRILSPIQASADATRIGGLLMHLNDLTARGFVDAEPEKQRLLAALAPPEAIVTIHDEKRTRRIEFYRTADASHVYARTTPDQPLFQVDPSALTQIAKSLFLLRDKRLFGIMPDELAILRVQTPTEHYALIHQTGRWILEDDPSLPLDQKAIQLFVSRVADLPAEFPVPTDSTTPDDYGFATPSAVFVGKDVRGLDRGRLILGKVEGGLVYAKGAGLPGIFQARSVILTQIPTKQELIETAADEDD